LDVAKRHRPLDAFFRGRRAVDLDETAITQYVAARQATVSRRGGLLAKCDREPGLADGVQQGGLPRNAPA
jgi:hypothetical protein